MTTRWTLGTLSLAFAATAVACGGDDGGPPPDGSEGDSSGGTGAVTATGGTGGTGATPGVGGTGGTGALPGVGGAGAVGAGGSGAAPGGSVDMTGWWAAKQVATQIVEAPIVGQQIGIATTITLLELIQSEGVVTATTKICTIDFGEVAGTKTVWPPAAIEALPVTTTEMLLASADVGASYSVPPTTGLLGWSSMAPATDPLPTTGMDPRVADADFDGKPGVTILVQGGFVNGAVYVVARTTVSFDGTIVSPDRVEGSHNTVSEQSVIGADNPLLQQNIPAHPDPDPAKNTFAMVRLPNPNPNCADVLASAPTLFP